jgi:prenyltransferase beta subunit
MKRTPLVVILSACLAAAPLAGAQSEPASPDQYPKHINAKTDKAVQAGLAYLAKTQTQDGNWTNSQDGAGYPISMAALGGMAFLANGNTTSRGPYAENVHKVVHYLLGMQQPSGIITGAGQEMGRPMYGHGFSMLFLASAYGMETDDRTRTAMRKTIEAAINLTARGQSNIGGWTYIPGGGDEGSVTVTQIQGLRAAQNAGFTVPKGTIEEAVRYLERCKQPGGGIEYSFGSGSGPRLAISAAAIATLYNAGEYDSKLADDCLNFVWKQFKESKEDWNAFGHGFYAHLYAAQAFYQAGDEYWDDYFPGARDKIVAMQARDGSWNGDGVGPVYGTSVALIILQLPYKFLPIYQR